MNNLKVALISRINCRLLANKKTNIFIKYVGIDNRAQRLQHLFKLKENLADFTDIHSFLFS